MAKLTVSRLGALWCVILLGLAAAPPAWAQDGLNKDGVKKAARRKAPRKKKARAVVPPVVVVAAPEAPVEPRYQRAMVIREGVLTHVRTVLAAFGTWKDDAELGHVWVPAPDEVGWLFRPYVSRGHWAVTTEGDWAWVSDYDWGHIPFHYGRWEWLQSDGWVWVPDAQWAPAWVVWRLMPEGYDYTAWAPTPATHRYSYDPSRGEAEAFERGDREGTSALRFMFVFNQYLFSHGMGERVIWDPDVAAWLGKRSKVYSRHGALLRPASPSFEAAAVPDYWAPVERITTSDPRIAPFVVVGPRG